MVRARGLLLLMAGCDDTIFGAGDGEVSGTGYAAVVQVFDQNCANGCHAASSAFGGLDLETDPCAAIVGVQAAGYDAVLVAPGDSAGSVLWNKMADTGAYGAVMPSSGVLDQELVDLVAAWIDEGASCVEDSDAQ
jgi:hypothetical protein